MRNHKFASVVLWGCLGVFGSSWSGDIGKGGNGGHQGGGGGGGNGSSWEGEAAHDRFGRAVSRVGDVDGDRVVDIGVGAPGHVGTAGAAGKAYVYSGATGTRIWSWEGEGEGDHFGRAIAGAGDVDGDGRGDILVGAPGHTGGRGKAYLYSGRTGTLVRSWEGESADSRFGADVARAGDMDRDQVPDQIVGAPRWSGIGQSGPLQEAGRAYVYSGATGERLFRWSGEQSAEQFGFSVSSLGDVQGIDAVVVGAPGRSGSTGAVYVFRGVDGARIGFASGISKGDRFGHAVTGVKSSPPRIVVGVPGFDGPEGRNSGCVDLRDEQASRVLAKLFGEGEGDEFGAAVDGVRDVDGDLAPDLVVGAPGRSGGRGAAYVFDGTGHRLIWRKESSSKAGYGSAVSGAGDVDGNKEREILVGAPQDSHNGKVYREDPHS